MQLLFDLPMKKIGGSVASDDTQWRREVGHEMQNTRLKCFPGDVSGSEDCFDNKSNDGRGTQDDPLQG